jgi:hypothetical protein
LDRGLGGLSQPRHAALANLERQQSLRCLERFGAEQHARIDHRRRRAADHRQSEDEARHPRERLQRQWPHLLLDLRSATRSSAT